MMGGAGAYGQRYGQSSGIYRLLFDMLYGLREPESGHLEIERVDPRDLRPDILRGVVALVREIEIFEGTIVDNIRVGRADVSMSDVRAALEAVGLLDDLMRLPDGLDTKLNASGKALQPTQQRLLMLARAIAGRPRLLLIDGVLDGLADSQLLQIGNLLLDNQQGWTVVVATNRQDVADQFTRLIPVVSTPSSSEAPLIPTIASMEQPA